MNELSVIIKTRVKELYGTFTAFAAETGLPRSTVSRLINSGPDSIAFATVNYICELLGITHPLYADSTVLDIAERYRQLDEKGRYTVNAVLDAEYNRCAGQADQNNNEDNPEIIQ